MLPGPRLFRDGKSWDDLSLPTPGDRKRASQRANPDHIGQCLFDEKWSTGGGLVGAGAIFHVGLAQDFEQNREFDKKFTRNPDLSLFIRSMYLWSSPLEKRKR